ncbi:hypothetical protein LUZ63_014091 [Rhynchospora breviuscula]|uniref:Uncharacterized protein n=1 Tax=Rhynchospora breviuscula TaxID=2022672 RepID=A0A9Q0HKT8_9POAL|nr:hypothetical protein LUZ63_014091 [Rhynchospora breviuscula]
MALTINCCLKPPTRSTLSPPGLSLKDQSDWRKKCVATMACVIISSTAGMTNGQDFAMAREIRPMDIVSVTRSTRWSDKRSCPPWRQNLLENIVPENLPRPSTSRRSNSVMTRQTGGDSGVGGKLIGFDKSCFSL